MRPSAPRVWPHDERDPDWSKKKPSWNVRNSSTINDAMSCFALMWNRFHGPMRGRHHAGLDIFIAAPEKTNTVLHRLRALWVCRCSRTHLVPCCRSRGKELSWLDSGLSCNRAISCLFQEVHVQYTDPSRHVWSPIGVRAQGQKRLSKASRLCTTCPEAMPRGQLFLLRLRYTDPLGLIVRLAGLMYADDLPSWMSPPLKMSARPRTLRVHLVLISPVLQDAKKRFHHL